MAWDSFNGRWEPQGGGGTGSLAPIGAWKDGFRPLQVRIYHNLTPQSFEIRDTSTNLIGSALAASGDPIPLNFVGKIIG